MDLKKNVRMESGERLPPLVSGTRQPPLIAPQPSIHSLTFNEFQNTLGGAGNDFGSTNMEELLKNICSANESLLMSSSGVASLKGFTEAGAFGLHRQGSLMTLPCTISLKTVDEVSRDLFVESGCAGAGQQATASIDLQQQHCEPTLGGTPLEEFLVRAGVVREEPVTSERSSVSGATATNTNNTGNSNNPNSKLFYGDFTGPPLAFTYPSRSNGGVTVSQPIQSNTLTDVDVSMPAFQLGNSNVLKNQQRVVEGVIPSGGASFTTSGVAAAEVHSPKYPALDKFGRSDGVMSSLSPVPYVLKRGPVRKNGALEKAVERRHQRMIKNRESAARSRARKQAYTTELESEVAKLKEQNQELRKKQKILEVQKKEVLEMIIHQPGTKRQRLRRTQTGPC